MHSATTRLSRRQKQSEELAAVGLLLSLVAMAGLWLALLPDAGLIPLASRWMAAICGAGAVLSFVSAWRLRRLR